MVDVAAMPSASVKTMTADVERSRFTVRQACRTSCKSVNLASQSPAAVEPGAGGLSHAAQAISSKVDWVQELENGRTGERGI